MSEQTPKPSRKKKAAELTTAEVMKRLFPKPVRDAAKKAAGVNVRRHKGKA